MIPDLIMLRLGELNLKGRNRSRFENTVLRHIKKKRRRALRSLRLSRSSGGFTFV